MRSARRDLWLCSPSTQEMASTTFDFPQPFGPTIHVVPEPLKVTTVRSQNDLKPTISTFRSLSKRSEEHTSELQSQSNLVCRLLLEKKKCVLRHIRNSA